MDGGRVLRALLNMAHVKRATEIAARVSQALCLGLAVTALMTEQPLLFVLAFFVFFGAVHEYVRAESRAIAVAFTAGDAMIPRERLEKFTHGTTISQSLKTALTSLQPLFPVMMGDELIGVVFRDDILQHAAAEPDEYVSAIMVRSLPHIDAEAPLSAAFSVFEETGNPVIMVKRGEYVGLLVQDRLAEFILMSGIRRNNNHNDDDAEWSVPL
jgi:CBS domain-containing protein